MVTRVSELFAISAAALLGFSFLSRVLANRAGVSIAVGRAAYVFSPSTVFLVMASLLCFFAAMYSIWPLPFNATAAAWHYWVSAAAITVFWACFYLLALNVPRGSRFSVYQTTVLFAQAISIVVLLTGADDLRGEPGVSHSAV